MRVIGSDSALRARYRIGFGAVLRVIGSDLAPCCALSDRIRLALRVIGSCAYLANLTRTPGPVRGARYRIGFGPALRVIGLDLAPCCVLSDRIHFAVIVIGSALGSDRIPHPRQGLVPKAESAACQWPAHVRCGLPPPRQPAGVIVEDSSKKLSTSQ